jgi:hypothetical protein
MSTTKWFSCSFFSFDKLLISTLNDVGSITCPYLYGNKYLVNNSGCNP